MEVIHWRECLNLTFNLLTAIGVWMPARYRGTKKAFYYRIFSCVTLVIEFFMFLLSQIIDAYLNMGDMEKLMDIIALIFTLVTAAFKAINVIGKQDKIIQLTNMLDEPLFAHVKNQHNRYVKKWKGFVRMEGIIYITLVTSTVFLWIATPILDNTNNNVLSLKTWLPLDLSNKYLFTTLYIYQSLAVIISAFLGTGVDLLIFGSTSLACAQLDVLCAELSSLGCDSSETQPEISHKDQLRNCVRHHEAIRKYVKDVQDIFSGIICVQFATSCLAICMTAFRLSLEPINLKFTSNLLFLAAIIMQLFLYCYHGNEIILKSLRISNAAYECPWYNEDPEFKQILNIMMERAKRPLQVTTASIFPLHLQTFTSILRSSYSYYAVLKRVHEVRQ